MRKAWAWLRRHPAFVAWTVLVVVIGVNQIQLQNADDEAAAQRHQLSVAVKQLETERSERLRAVNGVIFVGCNRNNEQDTILAGLVGISLQSGKKAQRAGQLSQAQLAYFKRFRRYYQRLNNKPNCHQAVRDFLRAARADPNLGIAPVGTGK